MKELQRKRGHDQGSCELGMGFANILKTCFCFVQLYTKAKSTVSSETSHEGLAPWHSEHSASRLPAVFPHRHCYSIARQGL